MKRTRDIAGIVGLFTAVAGIACYDWRAALVVGGVIVLGGSIFGAMRDKHAR